MIEQLKHEVTQIVGAKPLGERRDEDFAAYLTGIVQEKEEACRNKDLELKQAFVSTAPSSFKCNFLS